MDSSSETLYHYCSAESFMSIIENGNLRLSHHSGMNDARELKHIDSVLDQAIANSGKEYKHFDPILEYYNLQKDGAYLTCFSEDGDCLSQWRGYADDAKGYCIGFNKKILPSEKIFGLNANPKNSIGLMKVIYKKEDIVEELAMLLEIAESLDHPFLSSVIKYLSFRYKSEAFKEEKEWRMVQRTLLLRNQNGDKLESLGSTSPIKFRNSNYGLIPFFEYDFKTNRNNPIISVMLGPKNQSNPEFIDAFLLSKGFPNTRILKSAATYR